MKWLLTLSLLCAPAYAEVYHLQHPDGSVSDIANYKATPADRPDGVWVLGKPDGQAKPFERPVVTEMAKYKAQVTSYKPANEREAEIQAILIKMLSDQPAEAKLDGQ